MDGRRRANSSCESMTAVELHIVGRVQGVFYRASTCEVAQSLNVNGWVKNNSDGSVSVYAEGSEQSINKLIDWCHQGPEYAQVTKVAVTKINPLGLQNFSIQKYYVFSLHSNFYFV